MSEIDFAMVYKFVDPAIPKLKFQLRFRTDDVEAAVDRDHLPFLEPNRVNLAQIRRRIHNAGLD
jgi:hypothetical protein